MLALSPPLFSTTGWLLELEEAINHNQNNLYNDTETSDHYSFPEQPRPEVGLERSTPPSPAATVVKKLNHNASERDRRKKINSLYSSLRSLLPKADQMKKLSIPGIISRVLKYVPDLQQEVEGLVKKKEDLVMKISRKGGVATKESQRKIALRNSFFAVSTSRLNDCEAFIQISSIKAHKTPLSEVLLCLEKEGPLLLNASSFETFGRRGFYNLHFQVEKSYKLDSDILSEKLMSIYEKKETISPKYHDQAISSASSI
ncbi:hypothetical protein L6164_034205 [Bauhinia variegata]|uniref:Uncharacterized protein n=1 Tax=Bauhinia variegata TaxID=167791 RepID=A0ACB9KUY8_BAUVA|nr:hypothetical protein L6164_034205 [Bauhinia variegata]